MNTAPSGSWGSKTLRPRNNRRVPQDHLDGAHDHAASFATSSRTASPIPRAQSSPWSDSGSTEGQSRSRSAGSFLTVPSLSSSQSPASTNLPSIWESPWASLRGIASDIIGGNASRASSPGVSPKRTRRPLESTLTHPGQNSAAQWGPSAPGRQELGTGTRERQRAELEARKRERLLVAGGHATADSIGRYKRRASMDRDGNATSTDEGQEGDALVYVHKVQTGDTLAGVMIKYNCQPHVFRRANRLWPNDSIQSRKVVVLPVDACGKRGRKIADPELPQTLAASPLTDTLTTPEASDFGFHDLTKDLHDHRRQPQLSMQNSPSLSATPSSLDHPAYVHESWVIIDGFAEAVEIARMSRRTLGYFPRSRRKSQSFSDLDSPQASLDIPRASLQSEGDVYKARSRSSSSSYFARLQGPGGVGSMSRNVKNPGPANDGLNKLFPGLEQQVAPRTTPELQLTSFPQTHGIENVGGSIESWVRKLANKASTSLQPPTPAGRSDSGNLIELSEDAFELQDSTSQNHSSSPGGFTGPPRTGESNPSSLDSDLEETFPQRGRVFYDASRQH